MLTLCLLLMYLDESSARTSTQADSSFGSSEQGVENDAAVEGSAVGLYLHICARLHNAGAGYKYPDLFTYLHSVCTSDIL